ncbi:alpha/beta-hydrolase [Ophiobolus disseminans]|uniref:Alpha/beta-hydrolase n=1 Tax=Ophiobolus disseminans TaxID=1469910 RepID=A0A6A7A263_9PLEO|nr:alpha/beta-hydrolase [Ophiobolus disseminans]
MKQFFSFGLLVSVLLAFLTACGAVPTLDTKKPTIILIPAAFSKAAVYDEVKGRLSNIGYDVVAINLPSVGHGAGRVDRTPDIKWVQRAIGMRLRQGKNVVLVGNSYGATVICDAVKDFEARSMLKSYGPANGKISGLIFFSGFLPYINELSGARPDIRQISPPWFRFEATSRVFWDGDLAKAPPSVTLFNLLSKQQSNVWAAKLEPSSFAALNATAKYIPYDGKFRSLYVIASKDYAVTPAFAKTYIDQPGAKFETVTIDSDHMPMLSRPDAFVEVVDKFASVKEASE